MKKHPAFLSILLATCFYSFVATTVSAQWNNVGGNPTFNNAYAAHYSFAKDSHDTLYFAFADYGNNYIVTVKKQFGGGTWETVGTQGFITGSALFYSPGISIAINPVDNKPYIAISDGNNNNKVSVMKFNGTVWEFVGIAGFSPTDASGIKLAFNSAGVPYVAFSESYNNSLISVMRYNGAWGYAGATHFASGSQLQLVISPNNTISLAFKDQNAANKVSVMKLQNGAWSYAGSPGFSDDAADHINMATDAANALYVAYSDYAHSNKLTVKKLVGPTWTALGAPSFSAFEAKYTDLNINSFGVPYVSYVEGSFPVVQKFKNGNWLKLGNYVATTSCYHTSIVNDTLGNPYVLMALQPSSSVLPFVSKYSPCNDTDYHFVATAVQDSAISQQGGTTTVKVSATGGVAPYSGTGTFTVSAGYYTYTVTDRNGCTTTISINVTEPCTQNYWYGFISNNWEDAGNWSCGTIPGIQSDVFINSGTVVVNAPASVRSLQVDPNVSFTVASGVVLLVAH